MIRHCTIMILIYIGLLLPLGTTKAGQLSGSVEQYKAQVNKFPPQSQGKEVQQYLSMCLQGADGLNELDDADPGVPGALDAFARKRLQAMTILTNNSSSAEAVRYEVNAFNQNIERYRDAEYLGLVKLQDDLLDRKYLKTNTAKNGNYIEGFINGQWRLTQTKHGDTKEIFDRDHLGVSPWEALFRLEPALAIDDGAQPAILAYAGLNYVFFPDRGEPKTPPTFNESPFSEWLKKTGVRVGVGVGDIDDKARFLMGSGVQVNAVGLWLLYVPDNDSFLFGVALSDLSKLRKMVGWFD